MDVFAEIVPNLYQTNRVAINNILADCKEQNRIISLDRTHIINVSNSPWNKATVEKFTGEYDYLDILDTGTRNKFPPNTRAKLCTAVQKIRTVLAQNKTVIVHCTAGKIRGWK
eukprot:Phypoly_transcript_20924.p2 GENE.Phypoly_transcript_20924~~Phypoly_transcript_20924.p2  ORF type:complete len:113 (+),score=11.73 Phypoly_transcript_20924:49-387(+)